MQMKKQNKQNKRAKVGDVVKVTWLDANVETCIDKDEAEARTASSYLVPTETFGILFKRDSKALMILQEDSDSRCDMTCIPNSMLNKITKLEGKKK